MGLAWPQKEVRMKEIGIEIVCCKHVLSEGKNVNLIVHEGDYVKLNCGDRYHELSDYTVVEEADRYFEPELLKIITNLSDGEQAEKIGNSEWAVSEIDHTTRWTDILTDELKVELLKVADKVVKNKGLWIFSPNGELGELHTMEGSYFPMWFSSKEAIGKETNSSNLSEQNLKFMDVNEISDVFLIEIKKYNQKIILFDEDSSEDVTMYPIDFARFIRWSLSGIDPTAY